MPARVVFVCVENACRSQVAEAWARKLGAGVLEPASAGSRPSGTVHPRAVELMNELGVDLSGHRSKGLSDLPAEGWDYVVTMGCGDACPFVPARARLDWDVPDPKAMDRERFLGVCRLIEDKVRALVVAAAATTDPVSGL